MTVVICEKYDILSVLLIDVYKRRSSGIMNTIAFGLIVLSILMHSLWHFLCKSSGKSSMAFFALFSTSLFLTMLPFALCSGLLPALPFHVVKFAIGAALSGAVCNVGLMLAYKYCDISLAYPMARALPVFLTMVATVAFGWGKPLSAFAIVGMIVIFSGCLTMAFSGNSSAKSMKEKLIFLKRGLVGILIAACATTSYTIIDKYGIDAIMKFAPDTNKLLVAGTYSCVREMTAMISMWLIVGGQKMMKKEEGVLRDLVKKYHPYVAGFFAALAYVLILLAMNYVTNVSFVQAFRQLSLPLSAFLGYLILKEKIAPVRWIGLSLIMAGLILSVL